MIINIVTYRCPKCKKFYNFDESKEYNTICSNCNISMNYFGSYSEDTERTEKVPEMQPEQYIQYINQKPTPTVTCPYCQSTDTKKITNTSKAVHTALFGIFSISRNAKEWHCNNCKSDF